MQTLLNANNVQLGINQLKKHPHVNIVILSKLIGQELAKLELNNHLLISILTKSIYVLQEPNLIKILLLHKLPSILLDKILKLHLLHNLSLVMKKIVLKIHTTLFSFIGIILPNTLSMVFNLIYNCISFTVIQMDQAHWLLQDCYLKLTNL